LDEKLMIAMRSTTALVSERIGTELGNPWDEDEDIEGFSDEEEDDGSDNDGYC
jgi:hypothetical protein